MPYPLGWLEKKPNGRKRTEVKVKLKPRHEDVWRSGSIAPSFLTAELVGG
jgi:hypothetical protein